MSLCGEYGSDVIVPWKDGNLLNFQMFIKFSRRLLKDNYLIKLKFKPHFIFCACLMRCFVSVAWLA